METKKKIIINVGRQLGSGGMIIAKMLADEFGCKFYDRELLNLAAKESGFSEKFFEQNDEKKRFSTCTYPIFQTTAFITTSCRRKACSSFRATQYARLQKPTRACSWADVPTMCCATSTTW